jgi:hypothetical protein
MQPLPPITGGASGARSENYSGPTTFGAVNFSQDSGSKWIAFAAIAAVAFVMIRR